MKRLHSALIPLLALAFMIFSALYPPMPAKSDAFYANHYSVENASLSKTEHVCGSLHVSVQGYGSFTLDVSQSQEDIRFTLTPSVGWRAYYIQYIKSAQDAPVYIADLRSASAGQEASDSVITFSGDNLAEGIIYIRFIPRQCCGAWNLFNLITEGSLSGRATGNANCPVHLYSPWHDNGDGTHTRICFSCGHVDTAACSYGDWTSNGDGTHSRKCVHCGHCSET